MEGISACKNGVQSEYTEHTVTKSNGRTITAESTTQICNPEPKKTSGFSNGNASTQLRQITGGSSGQKNHGILDAKDRGAMLQHKMPEYKSAINRESSSGVKSFTPGGADDPAVRSKRAPGTPTRATGTPKK